MRWQESSSSSAPPLSVSEPYLPVEEVARRLDLPLAILLRRVEAGDVPARRIEGPEGVRYSLRLSDLGIEPDRGPSEPVIDLMPIDAVKPQVVPPFETPPFDTPPFDSPPFETPTAGQHTAATPEAEQPSIALRIEPEPFEPAAEAQPVVEASEPSEPAADAPGVAPAAEAGDLDVMGVPSGAWPDKVVPPPAEELAAEL